MGDGKIRERGEERKSGLAFPFYLVEDRKEIVNETRYERMTERMRERVCM